MPTYAPRHRGRSEGRGGRRRERKKATPSSSSASFPSGGAKRRRRRRSLLLLLSTPSLPLFSPPLVQRDSGGVYVLPRKYGGGGSVPGGRSPGEEEEERRERKRSAYVISAIWQHTSDTRKRKWSVLCVSLWETKVCVRAIQALRAPAAKKVRFRRSKLVFFTSCSKKEKENGLVDLLFFLSGCASIVVPITIPPPPTAFYLCGKK